jgi:phage portal protein BeeE
VNLLEAIRSRSSADRDIATLDDYASIVSQQLVYAGNQYSGQIIEGIYENRPAEQIATSLESYTRAAFNQSGVLFSVIAVRALVFSGVRFLWQRLKAGKTGDLFFTADLGVLSQPWPGGTTQDLLLKLELDATLAGNSYWLRDGRQLVRLRPDWVQIILAPRIIQGGQVGMEKVGFAYWEGGPQKGHDPVLFRASEVAHYAPMPDPLASYRGMSWITPIIPQIIGDKEMTRHKNAFFSNAATPQLSVSMDKAVSRAQFEAFIDKFEGKYRGAENAYKTMFLGGGADVKVIGTNFQQMDFSNVQGKAETLISAAGGVPPIIVGLSEGLASATYSNYSQARRRFADGTLHPLWANAGHVSAALVRRQREPVPPGGPGRSSGDPGPAGVHDPPAHRRRVQAGDRGRLGHERGLLPAPALRPVLGAVAAAGHGGKGDDPVGQCHQGDSGSGAGIRGEAREAQPQAGREAGDSTEA